MPEKPVKIFPWGNSRRIHAFSSYCIKTFGSRLQKLSIDAGFTCPNRDGTKGSGGCTFCVNDAFNPSYCKPEKSITQQINEGIEFHKNRYRRATKYIAYFQPFSNTYKDLGGLKKIYEEALTHPLISGISIGTRPDCVDDKKLDYLQQLGSKYFVAVEYGVESCNNKTLEIVNRGHTFKTATEAIEGTAKRGIFTAAHFIFGLPGETTQDILYQAQVISKLPLNSIKIHQLQILKNTEMARLFRKNPSAFHLFKLDEYIELVIDFLERLNPNIMVERLSGEVPPHFLETSSWGLIRNDQVLQGIEKRMEERETWQGRLFIK